MALYKHHYDWCCNHQTREKDDKQTKKKEATKSPKSFCGFLTIANKRESWGILYQYLFYGNNFFVFVGPM